MRNNNNNEGLSWGIILIFCHRALPMQVQGIQKEH